MRSYARGRPPLNVARRKALIEAIDGVLVFVLLFSPTITWSQPQAREETNLPECAQQSNPAPVSPSDSGAGTRPVEVPASQQKKDSSKGKQTKRMFVGCSQFCGGERQYAASTTVDS